ncbi:pilin glycosylation protein [Marinobacter santoriniensis NKSG1]|uniref:Pilin glycosylation protein n=1 Tax=Marinobacter santoriniensis NKSG1 TaxID=1288826 RepID=M7CS09_9GAMM|nr:acetyltransferase [Marinobacter santoriniensis]EMP55934.1 pilin glycosylation protein [Marinobacter santoriniensis NKSG1]
MRLAILGASGHGKVVADVAEASGWQEVVFFDDAWPNLLSNGPWKVLGDTRELMTNLAEFDGLVVGIGNNAIRANKQALFANMNINIVSIVHPSATVSVHAVIGAGTVIFANAAVNTCAVIGEGVIVNTGAVIEHDCWVGNFSHISPNAVLAGGAKLQKKAWLGACASVRQLLEIGEGAVVGMGAVVTKDVAAGTIVAGCPAKSLRP